MFKRVDGFEVEVVRRFVEDQEIRLLSIRRQKMIRAASPPERVSVRFSASSPLNSICPRTPRISACVAVGSNSRKPLDQLDPRTDRLAMVLREIAHGDVVPPSDGAGVDRE